jgi:hypothetical protein
MAPAALIPAGRLGPSGVGGDRDGVSVGGGAVERDGFSKHLLGVAGRVRVLPEPEVGVTRVLRQRRSVCNTASDSMGR